MVLCMCIVDCVLPVCAKSKYMFWVGHDVTRLIASEELVTTGSDPPIKSESKASISQPGPVW